MQATYFCNKLAVHRYKIALVILAFALIPLSGNAQLFRWARQHNPNYDDRKISYGFSIGVHTSSYQVKYSNKFITLPFSNFHRRFGSRGEYRICLDLNTRFTKTQLVG